MSADEAVNSKAIVQQIRLVGANAGPLQLLQRRIFLVIEISVGYGDYLRREEWDDLLWSHHVDHEPLVT